MSLVSNLIAQTRSVPQTPENPSEGFNFGDLIRIFKRRQRIALLTVGAVIGLTAAKSIYDRIYNPIYQGGFSLLISDPITNDTERQNNTSNAIIEQVARNGSSYDLTTLITYLQSPALLNPVYLRNPKASGILQTLSIKPGQLSSNDKFYAQGILNVSLQSSDPSQAQVLLNDIAHTYLKTAQRERQQRLADGLKFLNLQTPALERKSSDLQQQLALFRQRNTVLEPTEESSPLYLRILKLSDQILNLKSQKLRLLNVREAINKGSLTARSYKETIVDTGLRISEGTESGTVLSLTNSNQGLLEELSKLDKQLAESRAKFTSSSSMLKGLETQRQRLMPLLRKSQLETVESALRSNQLSLAAALQEEAQLKTIFQSKPQLIREYEEIKQKLKIANDNVASLIQAKENYLLEIAQKSVPWRVISPPQVSNIPSSPSIPRNLGLGMFLGLVAGAGAALLRDKFDPVFHNPLEVEEDLKETLLGHIPHVEFFKGVRENRRFVIDELDLKMDPSSPSGSTDVSNELKRTNTPNQISGYQRFFYQEAFRNLFTSLRFLNSDQPLRSVVLTSSVHSEGKSLLIVLLAKTLAEMGKRVLLIDADLRKPQMHYRLGLNNLLGLSNVLAEENCNWQDAIQQVKNYPTWSVITAGTRPPDPPRLLSSSRMHQVAQEISQSDLFDLVIYDTPPILGLADSVLVAEHVDGLIMLVSLNRVDRDLAKAAVKRIRSSSVTSLLGLVTNSINAQTTASSTYGYGYDTSNYGYGYGYHDTRFAYSYYNNNAKNNNAETENAESTTAPTRNKQVAALDWRQKLADFSTRIVRWIDR